LDRRDEVMAKDVPFAKVTKSREASNFDNADSDKIVVAPPKHIKALSTSARDARRYSEFYYRHR
jgi:hypothetical protein